MGPAEPQTVAVVVPVYNATFLADALDSVFQQTRPPDEVFVIDDGSPEPDAVTDAVARWRARVVLLRQPNAGAGAARNAGVTAARSELVAFLDADDRWTPTFLQDQLSFLQQHPDVDLVYADAAIVGGTRSAGRTFMSLCPSTGHVTLASLLAQRCTVLTSTVVARRALVVEAGGFDVTLRRGQDYDLWLRLASRGAVMRYQPHVLACRRIHERNLSGSQSDEIERALRVLDKAVRTLGLSDAEWRAAERTIELLQAQLARERGKRCLVAGDFSLATEMFERALRSLPGWKLRAVLFALRVMPNTVRRVYLTRASAGRRPAITSAPGA